MKVPDSFIVGRTDIIKRNKIFGKVAKKSHRCHLNGSFMQLVVKSCFVLIFHCVHACFDAPVFRTFENCAL